MKNRIVYKFLCITLLFPFLCYSQERPPVHQFEEDEYETQDDPYLPNAYNNKKLSPAYFFDSRSGGRTNNSEIITRQVNVHTLSQLNYMGDAANEPNIAINPENENEIAIGWRQFDNVGSNFRQAGWAYSSNGGQTWTFPGSIRPGVFQSDPVLDYDNNGNFYYNGLASSSAVDWPCYVYKSKNGGMSWSNGVYIGGGDKQWMTIDRSGGIGEGNIYSSWSFSTSECAPGIFTRSTDGGSSFDTCTIVPDDPWSTSHTVGNNGELYIAGRSPVTEAVRVVKSTNAQDPEQTVSWPQVTTCNLRGF
ncbi:MAG TPA: sialidase family protein, partial [Flavitalea sp.]|nr:sialidase family protein [Flavitalea sp.]